jgi:type IV pilus assembly protein PilO
MGKLTKEQQQMIAVAICLVFGVYAYFTYLLKPTLHQISERRTKLAALTQQIEVARQKANQLPALRAEYEALQIELNAMEKQLPKEKDLPGILRIITREALTENVSFSTLRPIDPKKDPSGLFDVIEFEVSVTGELHSFVRFMASLGQQDRIFQFDRVSLVMGNQQDGNPTVNVNFTLKTYAYAG